LLKKGIEKGIEKGYLKETRFHRNPWIYTLTEEGFERIKL